MIQSHMKNDKDISQLGMILQGIIEPHVNGGYRIYENTFITDDYLYISHFVPPDKISVDDLIYGGLLVTGASHYVFVICCNVTTKYR